MNRPSHQIIHTPSSRIGTIDLGRIGSRKHHVAGLLEIDVTDALENIRKRRAAGEKTTFVSWAVKTISSVLERNRYAQAMVGGRNTLVVFDDIDISIPVERLVEGERVPIALLIKKTNEKTEAEIYSEIQAALDQQISGEGDFVMSESRFPEWMMKLYFRLPQVFRLVFMRRLLKNPYRSSNMMGTAIVTTVGMASHVSGWFIPKSMHNLCFALGSVARKPWVVDNTIQIRDILNMTVLFDHDAVDGVPAAKFCRRLISRMQKGDMTAG